MSILWKASAVYIWRVDTHLSRLNRSDARRLFDSS